MASDSIFLNLPREIRDAIYVHYVAEPHGYVFDWESGKLHVAGTAGLGRAAGSQCAASKAPIDLGLAYTCKQVAAEMDGVALRSNTITFSTVYSEDMRVRAARFNFLRLGVSVEEAALLYYWSDETGLDEPTFTRPVIDEVKRSYPAIGPALEAFFTSTWRREPASEALHDDWGVIPSLMRRAIKHTLQTATRHGCFDTGPAARRPHAHCPPDLLLALDATFPAWSIPTDEDLATLSVITKKNSIHQQHTAEYWDRPHLNELGHHQHTQGKYRFSAAAVAIRFLSSLGDDLRGHLRRIRLLEDHEAVAWPETHAMGLIKYCVENPALRIERRVDLWRTVFQTSIQDRYFSPIFCTPEASWLGDQDKHGIGGEWAAQYFATWILEALALIPAGMPRHSFSLVLDAGPDPAVCSEIFQEAVLGRACRQAAWELFARLEAANPKMTPEKKRCGTCHTCDGFPEAISDIMNGTSEMISCTFDPGSQAWDAASELQKQRKDFERKLAGSLTFRFQTVVETKVYEPPPSLPRWPDILAEEILPEFFEDVDMDPPRPGFDDSIAYWGAELFLT